MSELKIQEWMRTYGLEGLITLEANYGIKSKQHPNYPNLWLFKYDQINSPMGERIVQECRGIILDNKENWKVVSRAFDKFFNHGEGHAAPIDWSSARVQEKVDGSLCVMYPYDGQWHVATSGTPDAGGEVNGFGFSFAKLFWDTMGETRKARLPKPTDDHRICYAFELSSPWNRVVVRHGEAKLTLLAARNLETQREISLDIAHLCLSQDFEKVNSYSALMGFEALEATFADMSPLSQEGYVVVDNNFNRVKVKHPGYVALHHSLGGMSLRALIEIARSGETSEILAAFPEFAPKVEEAKQRLDTLHAELDSAYQQIAHYDSQKEFALIATKTRMPAALFNLRAKKTESLRHYFRECRLDSLAETLGYSTSDEIERPALVDA